MQFFSEQAFCLSLLTTSKQQNLSKGDGHPGQYSTETAAQTNVHFL